MKLKSRYLLLITVIMFVGCMGPPADVVNPDQPDNGEKADPALVEEFKQAFGEFGKEDARKFGGLYLAYADLILTDTKSNKISDSMNWLKEAKESLKIQSYPGFKTAVVRETKNLQQNAVLDESWRKKIAEIFRRIGLAASEAGR